MFKKTSMVGTLALCTAIAVGSQTAAAASPVTMVMVVEIGSTPTATPAKLIELQKRGEALAKKGGPMEGKSKVYAPSLGGTPNQFVLVVDFASLAAYAASETAHAASPEWQKLNTDAQAAGIKLISRSLLEQISP